MKLLIATNNHVVSGATTLSVCFVGNDVVNAEEETVDMSGSDGDVNVEDAVSAKIKGTDESNDLAVVAVQKSDIPEDTLSQIKIAQLAIPMDLRGGGTGCGNWKCTWIWTISYLRMDQCIEQKHFDR